MEFLLSLALLVLNLIDYERDLGKPVFLAVSAVIFFLLFYFVQKRSRSFLTTCFVMMCYTWQISWINIFGDPTSELQLPWFYILGAFVVGYAIINLKKCLSRGYNPWILAMFAVFIIVFNYPLAISESISTGLKEYIMIGFFVVVLFAAYLFKEEITTDNYDHLKSAFIWAAFTSSFFLIFQYAMNTVFGIELFKINVSKYFSSYQVSYHLLMEDHSCSTIMLGCGVFYVAERITKKKWFIYVPAMLVIFVAMAVTSRRTSTLTLIIVLLAYVLFHYKGMGKKLIFLSIFVAAALLMLYYLLIVRPVETLSQAISDNGRFLNYISALRIFGEHPFGVGYDMAYLMNMMEDGLVPHNTLLRWLCMGGIPFTLPLAVICGYTVVDAYRKKASCEFWAILYSLVASNFIPDILNARYFVIPCAVVFLMGGMEKVKNEADIAVPPAGLSEKSRLR